MWSKQKATVIENKGRCYITFGVSRINLILFHIRAVPCNPARVFEFIWHLFVTLKGQYLSCSDDLVTSVHLVFACCDLAFKNAFLANRRDLFNPEFNGSFFVYFVLCNIFIMSFSNRFATKLSDPDYVVPEEAPCIMDKICGTNSSMETEAKYMKTYHCKSFLMSLFNNGTLQGNENDFTGLLIQRFLTRIIKM